MKYKGIKKLIVITVGVISIIVFSLVTKNFLIKNNRLLGSISDLVIKNNYAKFRLKTTPSSIRESISPNARVRNNSTELGDSDRVKSGSTLEVDNQSYTISVLGDVIPDGKLTINDVAKTYSHVINKTKTPLTDLEKVSADFTEDDKITIQDVAKMYSDLMADSEIHKVYIKLDMNGGSFTTTNENTSYGFDEENFSLLTINDSTIIHTIPYGGKLSETYGLANWNNPNAVYIKKIGYIAKENAEWINPENNRTYNQYEGYSANDFCDASEHDCTVTLKVNWTDKVNINFNANGGTVTTKSKEVTIHELYGELPIPTREGYTFIGWFDKDSTSDNDSRYYYKDSPFRYYADLYNDLYNMFGYNTNKLYSHYIISGKAENRRVSQYESSDTVAWGSNLVEDKTHTLYAGWMPISLVATFYLNGGTITNLGSSWTYTKSGKDLVDSNGNQLSSNIRYDYTQNGVLVGSPNYGNLPTVKKTGYRFMGWYDCSATSKEYPSEKYYENPLLYYLDVNPDLASTYAPQKVLNKKKLLLLNHYMNYGIEAVANGSRRVSQITSSDKVSINKNKQVTYCAGWIKEPVKNKSSECGVQSSSTTCSSYKTCATAACGREEIHTTVVNGEVNLCEKNGCIATVVSNMPCSRIEETNYYSTYPSTKWGDYKSSSKIQSFRYEYSTTVNAIGDPLSPSRSKLTKFCMGQYNNWVKSLHDTSEIQYSSSSSDISYQSIDFPKWKSNGYIYSNSRAIVNVTCKLNYKYREKEQIRKKEKLYNCWKPVSSDGKEYITRSCQHKDCGCADSNYHEEYNECWHE